jgi:hypothetical protein
LTECLFASPFVFFYDISINGPVSWQRAITSGTVQENSICEKTPRPGEWFATPWAIIQIQAPRVASAVNPPCTNSLFPSNVITTRELLPAAFAPAIEF